MSQEDASQINSPEPAPAMLEYHSGRLAKGPPIVSFGRLGLAFSTIGFAGTLSMFFLSRAYGFRSELHDVMVGAPGYLSFVGFGCGIGGWFRRGSRETGMCGVILALINGMLIPLITHS